MDESDSHIQDVALTLHCTTLPEVEVRTTGSSIVLNITQKGGKYKDLYKSRLLHILLVFFGEADRLRFLQVLSEAANKAYVDELVEKEGGD